MPTYLLFFLILLFAQLAYLRLAPRLGIVDNPNARSSHSRQTIRGGGLVFVLAVMLAWIWGALSAWVALGIILVGVVSLVDDIRGLSQGPACWRILPAACSWCWNGRPKHPFPYFGYP